MRTNYISIVKIGEIYFQNNKKNPLQCLFRPVIYLTESKGSFNRLPDCKVSGGSPLKILSIGLMKRYCKLVIAPAL